MGKECQLNCKAIFASPEYFPDKVTQVGEIVRCYCILNQPVKPDGKNIVQSGQIIIPGKEASKTHDVYVMWMGNTLKVAPDGYYIALVSTIKEGADAEANLVSGLQQFSAGSIVKKWVSVDPVFEPKDDGKEDNIFISKSYDATSHFEGCCKDCLNLYERYAGTPLELTAPEPEAEA